MSTRKIAATVIGISFVGGSIPVWAYLRPWLGFYTTNPKKWLNVKNMNGPFGAATSKNVLPDVRRQMSIAFNARPWAEFFYRLEIPPGRPWARP